MVSISSGVQLFLHKLMKIIAILLVLTACNPGDFRQAPDYDLEVEKKSIAFGDTIVSPVFSLFSIENLANTDSPQHLFLDRFKNIVITNPVQARFIRKIAIKRGDGPNSISSGINDFFPLSDSTFLIESFPSYYIINNSGETIKKIDILSKLSNLFGDKYEDDLYITSSMSHVPIINQNEYVLQVFRPNLHIQADYPEYPLFVKMRIDENLRVELIPLDIFFPEEFKTQPNSTYAQLERPKYNTTDNHIVFGFGFSSKVFMYNLANNTMSSLDLTIENGTNFSPPEPTATTQIGNILFTGFDVPLIDFENKKIFRHHIDVNEEDPMSSTNYLSVFDTDGKKLIESSLGKNSDRMLRNPFLLDGQFYMNSYFPATEEENLDFYIFSLIEK